MKSDGAIIGFDCRILRESDDAWLPDYLLKKDVEKVVSLDPLVFPISPREKLRREQPSSIPTENILGLLTDVAIYTNKLQNEYDIAGVVSGDVYNSLSSKFGSPLNLSQLKHTEDLEAAGWTWFGYDIIDLNGLISGLLNCGQHKIEAKEKFISYINQYSLFDDLLAANSYAEIRSIEIPTHNPFSIVSIWGS